MNKPIKFCSEAYFFRFLDSLPDDLGSEFLRPEKIHRPQPGLNPRTLDLEVSTLSETTEADYNNVYKT